MAVPKHIPIDIIQGILEYTSIGQLEGILDKFGVDDEAVRQKLVAYRCNPLIYLERTFDHAQNLLALMRCTGVVLGGSGGGEFYTPGLRKGDSDWDFFCPYDIPVMAVFTYHMHKMGVIWETDRLPDPIPPAEDIALYQLRRFSVTKGTLKNSKGTAKIQVIRGGTSFSVWRFHSTITQCFMTGFAAVSPYHAYTYRKESLYWLRNDTGLPRTQNDGSWSVSADPSLSEGKRKYESRGVKYVEYESRGKKAHGGTSVIGKYGGRYRNLGDRGCYIVSFKQYLQHENWEIPFDMYFEALSYVSFAETSRGTFSITSVLDEPASYMGRHTLSPWNDKIARFDRMDNRFAKELFENTDSDEAFNPTPWHNNIIRLYKSDFTTGRFVSTLPI
ncbi:hypothetical protein F5884DRAFT_890484 [Xylogone sp. PMI_703]|nr:hypothetical protein F5884DRAFT_890484 [Xylogone sp. PMI_703]